MTGWDGGSGRRKKRIWGHVIAYRELLAVARRWAGLRYSREVFFLVCSAVKTFTS